MFKNVLHNVVRLLVIASQIMATSFAAFIAISGWKLVIENRFNYEQMGLLIGITVVTIGVLLGTVKLTHHIVNDWLRKHAFKKALAQTEDFTAWCIERANSTLKGA